MLLLFNFSWHLMFYGTFFIYGLYVLLDVSTTTDRRQSKTPLTIDELGSKIARNSVFNCHLSSKWQPKTLYFTIIYLRLLIASFNMCPFKFCKHLDEEERAGCFALIVLNSCYCKCSVALPHCAVGWSAVCDCVYFLIILTFRLN